MVWNTRYLGTPSNRTTVLSGLSISGVLDVGSIDNAGAYNSSSAISGSTLRGTTLTLNAQPAMTLVSASSTTIVATTVVANTSTTTNLLTNSAIAAGDLIAVGPSALSAGVVLDAIASGGTTITFRYSNVSTANAAQVAINCRYQVWRF